MTDNKTWKDILKEEHPEITEEETNVLVVLEGKINWNTVVDLGGKPMTEQDKADGMFGFYMKKDKFEDLKEFYKQNNRV
jgi:hypothetical protein